MRQDRDAMTHPVSNHSLGDTSSDLGRSDFLLQAISTCVSQLLTADSVLQALPQVLAEVATTIHIDRMVFMEIKHRDATSSPHVFFVWSGPDAPAHVNPSDVIAVGPNQEVFEEWVRPLHEGKIVIGLRRTSEGPVREFLTKMNVISVLQVPIMINGRYWGQIAFEDCKSEHEWTRTEINILKILADLIGTAVTRERSMVDLRHRDAILNAVTASAVEIMTSPYLHEAISKSLESVAKAVRADRMFVLEVVQSNKGMPQVLLRNAWHAPTINAELDTILRVMAEPGAEDILKWAAPLQQGHAITGALSTVTGGGLKNFFTRMKVQSTLIVPIMVDGKYWGHISFDDCHNERTWTVMEIDILKTLAQLIGTAITRERYVEELGKANTIVQNSPTILYRLRGDPAFPLIYISQNIALLEHNSVEWLDSPTLYQSYVHPEDRSKVQSTMVGLLRKNAPPVTIEYRMLSGSGNYRWMENRFSPVRDTNGRLIEVEGIMIDITERKVADDRIALLARTDALTGLANRVTFNDRLRQAFATARRGGTPFAVLYLDLDRFKEVNDTRGHPIGDLLLQNVAERLKNATRETDLVARLGGDEFAVLQTDVADSAVCGTLAEKLISALSAPYLLEGHESRIGSSVGVAVYSDEADSPETLLVQADQALYRAKEEGRGQYRFHSNELDVEAHEQVTLAQDLRRALDHNELELYYQPQVELSSGVIVGMEALIRWNHPTRGKLLPDVFLPIAEKSGIAQALGRWVLDGACRQMAQWREAEVHVPVVAVNVALAQIKSGKEFVRDVKESLARWRLKPSELELDVTEFILARTTLSQSNVLEELRRLGVCIAIDDFGAQYSSLDYLRTYHVSRLKIARPMVAAATDEQGGLAMIRAIVGLASELGVDVIAEGIETDDQRAVLAKMSAKTKGQGFFFSQPMPAEDTIEILRLSGVGLKVDADSEDSK